MASASGPFAIGVPVLATLPGQLDDLIVGLVFEPGSADQRLFDLLAGSLAKRHFLAGLVRVPADPAPDPRSLAEQCHAVALGVVGAVAGGWLIALGAALEGAGVPAAVLVREDYRDRAYDAALRSGCPGLLLVPVGAGDADRLEASGVSPALLGLERAICSEGYRLDASPLDASRPGASPAAPVTGEAGPVCLC